MNFSPPEQLSCFPSAYSLYVPIHRASKFEAKLARARSQCHSTYCYHWSNIAPPLACAKKTLAIASLCYIIYIHRITVGPFTQPRPPLKLHPNPHHDTLNIPTHHPTSQHLQNSHPSPKRPLTSTGNISPKTSGNLTHSLPGWLGWRKKR